LAALGVTAARIYIDEGFTGTNRERPSLDTALGACREGDTLVITKLDRLGRSVPDLRAIADELRPPQFAFRNVSLNNVPAAIQDADFLCGFIGPIDTDVLVSAAAKRLKLVQLMSAGRLPLLEAVQRIGARHGLELRTPLRKPVHADMIREAIANVGLGPDPGGSACSTVSSDS